MSARTGLIRDIQAGGYLDGFLVSAVGAILAIRSYLHIAGYPQIGGETLHIAHMLWGGLLMLAAIVVLFSFLGRPAQYLAMILGGIGFGTFIDEVGKFVTQDNDYFFQPSVAIIYATFVTFYLVGRLIHGRRDYTRTEYLVNALKETSDLAADDLDEEEKGRAVYYLSRSDPENPLAVSLTRVLAEASLVPVPRQRWISRVREWLHKTYLQVADLPGFATILTIFFVGQMFLKLGYVFALIFLRDVDPSAAEGAGATARLREHVQDLTFSEQAEIIFGLAAAVFVLLGVVRLRKSRLDAYRLFRTSVLINVFLVEIFIFAQEEFGALTGFSFNLLVLVVLAYLIDREKLRIGFPTDASHVSANSG